jgi:hypothetical protein
MMTNKIYKVLVILLVGLLMLLLNGYFNDTKALGIIVETPYHNVINSKAHEGGTYQIVTNVNASDPVPLNGLHYTTPDKVGVIPSFCNTSDDCTAKIKSIEFILNGESKNVELYYKYDLLQGTDGSNDTQADSFSQGYNVLHAKITESDDSVVNVYAQFFSGDTSLQSLHDLTLYYFTSDKQVEIRWNKNVEDSPTHYDLILYNNDIEEVVYSSVIIQPVTDVDPQHRIKVPRTGHYIVKVRSVEKPLSDELKTAIDDAIDIPSLVSLVENNGICDYEQWLDQSASLSAIKSKAKAQKGKCSDYASSVDTKYATVEKADGVQVSKGWWLYGHISAPTGGGITGN